QVPVIDDDGIVLSESAAILVYLAKKSGRLIPQDPAGEAQVIRWCFAATNTLEVPLLARQVIGWFDKSASSIAKKTLTEWAQRHLANLDPWLASREFVAVDQFTIADILMTHVIGVEAEAELLAPYAHVRAYLDRCHARPAWHRAHDAYCARVEAA
ncbi:MAG: glutathione S-transferase family protein, partial [Kofleriaceae bacterium]